MRHAVAKVGGDEFLHKSKPGIASPANQPNFACQACADGSPRRCAPRDDGLMQTFPRYLPSRNLPRKSLLCESEFHRLNS